ncbi:RNA methyltransferase [Corynebacterium sp. sy017]|uniref:TrmH family RNA methyltransferase n=1 Tax=unclassified Corynebacterium TaxID=2624378 RepID=UPI001185E88F|nr:MULTISPECIES: RNA methyltransferase [unclassified Corynebacterium]MBP3088795.1 RNA methyltransferase [Corynebacterium sp. sy017]TSD91138.1 RNA methyltransferase [Corynebacterium sp. SY003]
MSHVSDPEDSRLDDFRNLNHSDNRPDLPDGKGLIIAEGPLVVERLLFSRFPVRALIGFPSKLDSFLEHAHIREYLSQHNIAVHSLERHTLAQVAGFDMHRGLLASAQRVPELAPEKIISQARTVVVLEGVGDHENIGAIFRNAAGMDIDAVFFGNGCADPLYRRVVRVSMGHVLRTPFSSFPGKRFGWQTHLAQLRDAGFHLVALTPDHQAVHIADAIVDAQGKPYDKVAFIVGAEGPGLTGKTMRAADVKACIPMAGGTDSLNVATAAAIAFYERQRSLRT